MTLQVHKVHHSDLEHFLLGGIMGAVVVKNSPGISGLVGKTLNFTAPVGVVTFVAPDPLPVFDDVNESLKLRIETDVAALRVTFPGGRLAINLAVPGTGVALANTGTANPLLGFSTATATAGTYYNPPGGGAPELVSVGQIGDGYLQVITDE